MQSFLQYRRFRTTVAAQLERDRAKAQLLGDLHRSQFQEDQIPSSAASDSSKSSDPEKGGNGGRLPHRVDPRTNEAREEAEAAPEEDDDDDDADNELAQQRTTLSRATTVQSARHALGRTITGVAIRKRTTHEGGDGDVFVVGFEHDRDPNDPHCWPLSKRIPATLLVASIGCVVGLASAIDSSAVAYASKEFHVSEVVESMATGLFLIGFGVGSLFAGPISETVGRNPVYIVTLVLYMIFIMASALAPNIGAQLVFRFLAGFFGSTPLTCAGGSISDMWDSVERIYMFPVFANAAFTGPLLGPVIGGYTVQYLDWRWCEWFTLIISGVVFFLVLFFQPETFAPILLKWKAKHMRDQTGDSRYCAAIEIREETFIRRLKRALWRPFLLTAREPIIMLVALYLTVVYIVLFTFLDGYEFVFGQMYGLNDGLVGLCFFGIIIGLFGASALVPLIYKWAMEDMKKIRAAGGDRLPPEFRLWYSMLGGAFAIPISLFWMGWTARPDVSIWSPLAASVLFGFGILCIFITCYQ